MPYSGSLMMNMMDYSDLLAKLKSEYLGNSDFYLEHQGKILNSLENVKNLDTVRVNLRLRGGKGGFGSLLKAQACNIKVMLKFNY